MPPPRSYTADNGHVLVSCCASPHFPQPAAPQSRASAQKTTCALRRPSRSDGGRGEPVDGHPRLVDSHRRTQRTASFPALPVPTVHCVPVRTGVLLRSDAVQKSRPDAHGAQHATGSLRRCHQQKDAKSVTLSNYRMLQERPGHAMAKPVLDELRSGQSAVRGNKTPHELARCRGRVANASHPPHLEMPSDQPPPRMSHDVPPHQMNCARTRKMAWAGSIRRRLVSVYKQSNVVLLLTGIREQKSSKTNFSN